VTGDAPAALLTVSSKKNHINIPLFPNFMISISTILKHYKRADIQEAMVRSAKDKEVAIRYGDKGFGKRPDILSYPRDVIEFAKNYATSLHVSEEHWENPLMLSPGLKRAEIDSMRIGWDLCLDVDCKMWKYSKIITHLLIEELKAHGVKSVSCKFSGNKGFHVGVPFKAFPSKVNGVDTKLLFPDGVRRIAAYLRDRIEPKFLDIVRNDDLDGIGKELGKEVIVTRNYCKKCGKEVKEKKEGVEFVCQKCGNRVSGEDKFMVCEKCNSIMEKFDNIEGVRCTLCESTEIEERVDSSALLDIDTVLISSRHLYRMVYSLHEKSGLVSVPVKDVMKFEKDMAKPEKVKVETVFLDDSKTIEGEATNLIIQAFDHKPKVNVEEVEFKKEFDVPSEAIPPDLFPPCVKIGLGGLEDGKKRFMFCLMNFLSSCGYGYDEIESVFKEWNENNPEPLREVILLGQLRYHKMHKKKILPPNCDNKAYYADLQICKPDGLCGRIKNPVQYSTRKAFAVQRDKSAEREKLTDEQKEMRKKYREKIKEKS